MNCIKCESELLDNEKYCPHCGTAAEVLAPAEQTRAFCSGCGGKFSGGEKFCGFCGATKPQNMPHVVTREHEQSLKKPGYRESKPLPIMQQQTSQPPKPPLKSKPEPSQMREQQISQPPKRKKKKITAVIVIAIILALVGGLTYLVLDDIKKTEEAAARREEALARPYHIENAEQHMISNQSIDPIFVYAPSSHRGGEDVNTVNFSMGPSMTRQYFLHKYANTQENRHLPSDYRYLLLNINMIKEGDMETYWPQSHRNLEEVREGFTSALRLRTVYWGNYLLCDVDQFIQMNIRIRRMLARSGYIDDITFTMELINFVDSNGGIPTLNRAFLRANEGQQIEITRSLVDEFTGAQVYFDDFSIIGKLAFLQRVQVEWYSDIADYSWYWNETYDHYLEQLFSSRKLSFLTSIERPTEPRVESGLNPNTPSPPTPTPPPPPLVRSVAITYNNRELYDFTEFVGRSVAIDATVDPPGFQGVVVWTSSDSRIFEVSSMNPEGTQARITPISRGAATLTASVGDVEVTCTVRVRER